MMMNKQLPWDQLSVPKADFTVMRVPDTSGVPIYWGRDSASRCLLVVELTGDFSSQLRRDAVAVNGVTVDVRMGEKPGQQRLVLALARHVDGDLFFGLCQTLIKSLRDVEDSATALAVALAHIKRWKAFLAGRGARLSQEEVRGLFAELTYLGELIEKAGAATAVDAWMGPEKSHQDFIYGDHAVEIKSLSGAERNAVRISSEDQLESLNSQLFLRVYRLSSLPDAPAARSLNAIVEKVQGTLDAAEAIEAFESKLAAHGYAPLPDYDDPAFVVSEIHTYRVGGEFPRLVRSAIPTAVGRVSYDIKLESIAAYECDPDNVFSGG